MKVILNEVLIKNLFTILDENHDNEITLSEFKAIFAGPLGEHDPENYDLDREADILGEVQMPNEFEQLPNELPNVLLAKEKLRIDEIKKKKLQVQEIEGEL